MRTALLQSSGRPGSVAENLKVLDEAAGRAAAAGAGLLAAPEMFLTGYAIGDDIARLAEPADGDSRGHGRGDRRRGTASRSRTATPSAPRERGPQLRPADLRRRRPSRELPQDPPLRLLRARPLHARGAAGRPGRAGRPPRRPA